MGLRWRITWLEQDNQATEHVITGDEWHECVIDSMPEWADVWSAVREHGTDSRRWLWVALWNCNDKTDVELGLLQDYRHENAVVLVEQLNAPKTEDRYWG